MNSFEYHHHRHCRQKITNVNLNWWHSQQWDAVQVQWKERIGDDIYKKEELHLLVTDVFFRESVFR
jgi:hypothetical protein